MGQGWGCFLLQPKGRGGIQVVELNTGPLTLGSIFSFNTSCFDVVFLNEISGVILLNMSYIFSGGKIYKAFLSSAFNLPR